MMKRAFHPFLLAIYIVLFQYTQNQNTFPFWVIYEPLLKALIAVAAIYPLLFLWLRNSRKAGILVSVFIGLLVLYGRVIYSWYPEITVGGHRIFPQIVIGAPLFFIYALFVWLCRNYLKPCFERITRVANIFAIVLCILALSTITLHSIQIGKLEWHRHTLSSSPIRSLSEAAMSRAPHIFHIIMDEYGQAENLHDLYHYDNSPFLSSLKDMEFYVADSANANYSNTVPAVASVLNYAYLSSLVHSGDDQVSYDEIRQWISNCRLKELLHEHGYRFVSLPTGFYSTNFPQYSDIFVEHGRQTEFERTLLDLTIAPTAASLRDRERRRILSTLHSLPELARQKQPLYVFAHILAPHPPFVFDENGNDPGSGNFYGLLSADELLKAANISRKEYARRYIAQLHHINKLLQDSIREMIRNSSVSPIIIIHGDHGGGAYSTHEDADQTYYKDRMGILCAVRIPGEHHALYPTITPVNVLLVALNRALHTSMPLLEDRSYFVSPSHPYRYLDSTGQIGSEADKKRLERMLAEPVLFPNSQKNSEIPMNFEN
jgi:hypothetical protein